MNRKTLVRIVLRFIWWLLTAGGLLNGVRAQGMVSAWIVTPEADRKEGGQVDMTCLAVNLESTDIVAWRTNQSVGDVLRWDEETRTANQRFVFQTTKSTDLTTVQQDFSITDFQKRDTGEYVCDVYQTISIDSYRNVGSSSVSVMLSVLYFPSESFPVCFPDGRFSIDPGTELNLRCLSEIGNPEVMMEVLQTGMMPNRYTWASSTASNTVLRSLHVNLTLHDSNIEFRCSISSVSFPDMTRSCTIGPITIRGGIQPSTGPTSTTAPTTETDSQAPTPTATNSAIVIAGTSVGGAVVFLLLVILTVICWRRGLCKTLSTLQKPDTKRSSSPTNIVPTTDALDHPGPNSNEESSREMQEFDTHQDTTPVTITAKYDTTVHYALPHKSSTDDEAKIKIPDKSKKNSTEQVYSNPVFDRMDPKGTNGPFQEGRTAATLKPVAKVLPVSKAPKKPQPYKPKAQRESNTSDNFPNQQDEQDPSRPQSIPPLTTSVAPTKPQPYKPKAQRAANANGSTPNQQNSSMPQSSAPPPPPAQLHAVAPSGFLDDSSKDGGSDKGQSPPGEASYALVSSPYQSENKTGQSPRSKDIVYADLDLQSDPPDVNNQPVVPSASEPVVYASVMNVEKL